MFDTVVVVDSLGAWRAPIAGFIAQFIMVGYSLSSGILLLGLHEDYEVPHELLLPTAIISTGLMLLLSPIVEFLSVRIGSKASMLASLLTCTFSFVAFLFVPITGASVVILQGVTVGIGRSFGNFVLLKYTMIAFKKRRGVAASVLKTGASVGAICFPPLFAFLLDYYGVRITLFLIGGIFLNLLIVLVLIPSVVLDDKTGRRLTPLPKWLCCQQSGGFRNRAQSIDSATDEVKLIKEPLAVKLVFLLFTCFVFLVMFATAMLAVGVFALYGDEIGLTKYMIAATISTRSGVDVCMRMISGFLFDRIGARGKILTLAFGQFIGLLGVLPLLFFTSHALAVMLIYAVCMAVVNSLSAIGWMQIAAILSGTFYVGRVMSFIMLAAGGSLLTSSFGLGVMRMKLGTYRHLYFLFATLNLFIGLGYFSIAMLFSRCSKVPVETELDEHEMAALNKEEK